MSSHTWGLVQGGGGQTNHTPLNSFYKSDYIQTPAAFLSNKECARNPRYFSNSYSCPTGLLHLLSKVHCLCIAVQTEHKTKHRNYTGCGNRNANSVAKSGDRYLFMATPVLMDKWSRNAKALLHAMLYILCLLTDETFIELKVYILLTY